VSGDFTFHEKPNHTDRRASVIRPPAYSRILFESDKPLGDCQQLGPLFEDKERRLFLVLAVVDDEVEAMFALLQAFESLRKKAVGV
jgi:hypothetical protein